MERDVKYKDWTREITKARVKYKKLVLELSTIVPPSRHQRHL